MLCFVLLLLIEILLTDIQLPTILITCVLQSQTDVQVDVEEDPEVEVDVEAEEAEEEEEGEVEQPVMKPVRKTKKASNNKRLNGQVKAKKDKAGGKELWSLAKLQSNSSLWIDDVHLSIHPSVNILVNLINLCV